MAVKLVKNIVLLAAEAILPPHTVGRPRVDHSILLDQFLRVPDHLPKVPACVRVHIVLQHALKNATCTFPTSRPQG